MTARSRAGAPAHRKRGSSWAVRLARVSEKRLAELLEHSWRRVAGKRLAAVLDRT